MFTVFDYILRVGIYWVGVWEVWDEIRRCSRLILTWLMRLKSWREVQTQTNTNEVTENWSGFV